jgi:hypothetical protein
VNRRTVGFGAAAVTLLLADRGEELRLQRKRCFGPTLFRAAALR